MGCGSSGASSPGVNVDSAMEELMKTGHSTGQFSQKLTKREWENLTFGTRSFIEELDQMRLQD